MNKTNSKILVLLAILAASVCHATPITYYIVGSTNANAQTSVDSGDSVVWYPGSVVPPANTGSMTYTNVLLPAFDPTSDWQLGGLDLYMKRGNKTSENITLDLWQGSIGGTLVDSVTLTPSDFTQQFQFVQFYFSNPDLLVSGQNYIATLTSPAAGGGSNWYFLDGAIDSVIQDANGNTLTGEGDPLVPEPSTWKLLVGGLSMLLGVRASKFYIRH